MKKIKCFYQVIPNECAACCVATIMDFYNFEVFYEKIKEELGIGRGGTSFSVIKRFLIERGFKVSIYEANVNGLYKLNKPAIISWVNHHYVVLKKVTLKYVEIVDPICGVIRYNFSDFQNNYTGFILVPVLEKDYIRKKRINIKNNFMRSFNINKKELSIFIILSLVFYIVTLMQPIILNLLISTNSFSAFFIILFVACYGITLLLTSMKQTVIGNKAYINISKQFIDKLLNLPLKFYYLHSSGDILFRIECLSMIRSIFFEYLLGIFFEIGTLIIMTIYMFTLSKELSAVVCLIGSIGVLTLALLIKRINMQNSLVVKEDNNFNSINTEIIGAIEQIKMANAEQNLRDIWWKHFINSNHETIKREKIQNIYLSLQSVFNIGGPIAVLGIGLKNTQNFDVTFGQIFAFYSIANIVFSSVITMLTYINSVMLSKKYYNKVLEIENLEEENNLGTFFPRNKLINLEVKDLSYKFNKFDDDIISNVNFKICTGEVIAIVGESGTGKSTLIKILAGIYLPTAGSVLINGVNINNICKQDYKKAIGIITSESLLLNNTIYENIILGSNLYDKEDVVKICEVVGIHEEILRMPMEYSTIVGAGGNVLSSGQRQRIIFARTLLKKPKILLLDEAMNSLDALHEQRLMDYVNKQKIMSVIITHRLSLATKARKIFVMDKGQIVEAGTHQELLHKKGLYYTMYQKQM